MSFFKATVPMIMVPLKYEWNVAPEQFNRFKQSYANLETPSPLFGPANFESIKFQLQLHYTRTSGLYGIRLILFSSDVSYLKVKCNKDLIAKLESGKSSPAINSEYSSYIVGSKYSIWQSQKRPEDSFRIITCELKLKFICCLSSQAKSLTNELNLLRKDDKIADVVFVVGEKEFPANKMIMSARSPVFATMFASNEQFVENQTNRVKICDVDELAFEAFLDFIYTSEVESKILTKLASSLYTLAHMYDIKTLLPICVESMLNNITSTNVIAYLLLANTYGLVDLKAKAIDCINRYAGSVTKQKDWENFVSPNNDLMNEIYKDMVNKHPGDTKMYW